MNRVYPGKEGGLVVDYMGIGAELKKALMNYTESGGKGKPTLDQETAVKLMQEKYEVVRDMFHGFDYRRFFELKPSERMSFIPQAMEHILKEMMCVIVKDSTALLQCVCSQPSTA